MDGVLNKNWGLLISPRRPLADNFLYRALLLVSPYKCAKFQLPSSISYEIWRWSQNKKWELLISPDVL